MYKEVCSTQGEYVCLELCTVVRVCMTTVNSTMPATASTVHITYLYGVMLGDL